MIKKVLRFIYGYLIVEISGNALERFINQLTAQGINIWNLKRISKDRYQARVYAAQYKKLKPLVRKRMCWVKIKRRKGFPFFLKNTSRRLYLLLGLILVFFFFFLGSSFLWFIKIDGLEQVSAERINQILLGSGVKSGIMKKDIDLQLLEREVLKNESRIAWVNARWQGTQLYIRVVEKKLVEEIEAGNLYAAKDGVITKFIVLKGTGLIKDGDTVTRGQPLILAKADERARGIVRAVVWYEGYGISKIDQQEILYTGSKIRKWGLKINDKIIWLSTLKPSFKSYQRKREIKTFTKWRNINFPIELIKEEFLEVKLLKEYRSKETALFLSKEKALTEIISLLSPGAVIQDIIVEELASGADNLVKVRVIVAAEEDIAGF